MANGLRDKLHPLGAADFFASDAPIQAENPGNL